MAMPPEVMKLLAHVDQTRADMRAAIKELPRQEQVQIIKTAASGKLNQFDERTALLVGMLAVVAMFDLLESKE